MKLVSCFGSDLHSFLSETLGYANTSVFQSTLCLMLYLANLIMIGLDCSPFSSFPIQLLGSKSTSLSFSCKSSFKISVTTTSVSSFSFSHVPKCNAYENIAHACQWLCLNKQLIYTYFLFFLPVH